MAEEVRLGYYKDRYGRWHKDRRSGQDRRAGNDHGGHERRKLYRRKADREQYEQDKAAIEDALEEFASEHDGHV